MTEDELKAIDQRLAAMSERVNAVIEREKPLGKRMPILDFKPRAQSRLSGSEGSSIENASPISRRARYVSPPEPDLKWREDYSMRVERMTETHIEQIFADFERQFDEMAQAHRYRG